jgi:NADPH-dependent curcumin reductase CurA
MLCCLGVQKGETVVISGAAGAVGSMAGQIAKIMGARVIGVVGSPSKAKWITDDLGFDGAINYKTDDINARLKELAPDGVDCYFENTGGPTSDAVFMHFNTFARMAFCGLIDTYNKKESPGPKSYNMFLMRRVTVQGFICTDHMDEYPEMLEFVKKHVDSGKIKHKVDVREGLDNYIEVLNLLFSGGNTGKLCLKP